MSDWMEEGMEQMVSESGTAARARRAGPPLRNINGSVPLISTFELSLLRARMFEAARAKARRGELRILVPPGYIWDRDAGLDLDPDERLQATIRGIFGRFRRLGRCTPGAALVEGGRVPLPQAIEQQQWHGLRLAPHSLLQRPGDLEETPSMPGLMSTARAAHARPWSTAA